MLKDLNEFQKSSLLLSLLTDSLLLIKGSPGCGMNLKSIDASIFVTFLNQFLYIR